MATIVTERQALVAMATILQGLDTEAGEIDLFSALAQVLAVLAAGLVVEGAAGYRPHTVAPITLAQTGELRVQTQDRQVAWFGADPFAGEIAWEVGA